MPQRAAAHGQPTTSPVSASSCTAASSYAESSSTITRTGSAPAASATTATRPPDPLLVSALIAALETQHLALAGDGTPEGSTTATFTPSGGGLSLGGGTKRVKTTVRNDAVLETLVAITGVNFEWNAAAWRTWLASRESPADQDLRRGR